eukprot:187232-Pyramimonas_sp.AAC.3
MQMFGCRIRAVPLAIYGTRTRACCRDTDAHPPAGPTGCPWKGWAGKRGGSSCASPGDPPLLGEFRRVELLVDDAPAGGHPLDVPRANHVAVPNLTKRDAEADASEQDRVSGSSRTSARKVKSERDREHRRSRTSARKDGRCRACRGGHRVVVSRLGLAGGAVGSDC